MQWQNSKSAIISSIFDHLFCGLTNLPVMLEITFITLLPAMQDTYSKTKMTDTSAHDKQFELNPRHSCSCIHCCINVIGHMTED